MLIPRPHVWKPPAGTPLDPAHPLAQNLLACYAFNEGAGLPRNLVNGVVATANTGTWGPTAQGLAMGYATQATSINNDTITSGNGGPLSIVIVFQSNTPSSVQFLASTVFGGGAGWNAAINNATQLRYSVAGPGSFTFTCPSLGTGWHTYGISHATTGTNGVAGYLDGALLGYDTISAFPGATTGITSRTIGSTSGPASPWLNGSVALLLIYSGALSAGAHAALDANPWQIFQSRSIVVPAKAASPGVWTPPQLSWAAPQGVWTPPQKTWSP